MKLLELIVKRFMGLILPFCLLAGGGPQLSVMEAADYLYETCFAQSFPDAQRVDTAELQGYILEPLHDLGGVSGQQAATELCHYQTGKSGEYYGFWLHSYLVDDPETGAGHCSTLNFFAVSAQENGPILMQRTNWSDGLNKNDPEFDEAFDREMDRWNHFWCVVDGEEALVEDDPLRIN